MTARGLAPSDPAPPDLVPTSAGDWLDLRSDASPRALLIGLSAILTTLLLWSCIADLDRVVRGAGRIAPTDSAQIVQHLEGGIISEIDVVEGQRVRRGDVLLRLRSTDASTALTETQQRGAGLRARLARLQAEASGAPAGRNPEGLTAAAPEMAAELSAFQARRLSRADSVAAERARLDQKQAEIAAVQQKLRNYRTEHDTALKQLQVIESLRAQHAASQIELLDAQARDQRLQSLIQETESALPALSAGAAELRSRTSQTEAQFRAEAQSELTAVELELDRSQQDARSQSERLNRTEVRAPVDGVVNHLFLHTIGGVTRPGEPLVELTPVNGELIVEGRIRPGDRGELRPGLPATVRINAYDYSDIGSLPARIIYVGADTIADERGERYYQIKAVVNKDAIGRAHKLIFNGMTTTLDIVVGHRKIIQYMISPILHFSSTAFREAK